MMNHVTLMAISFFFSAFGDRLWMFAVGLYLVKLTPGSLQLTAIYGLVQTATAILFSPVIGGWIDRTNRLKAVRVLLVLTNVKILLCAVCILVYLHHLVSDTTWLQVLQAVIILLGASANLSGVGEKICVSKDWIVVVCKEDKELLATANALLRRIDLSVKVVAPIGVGLLMTVISDWAGLLFICIWNVVTVIAEYWLLLFVYNNDADLHHKVNDDDHDDGGENAANNEPQNWSNDEDGDNVGENAANDEQQNRHNNEDNINVGESATKNAEQNNINNVDDGDVNVGENAAKKRNNDENNDDVATVGSNFSCFRHLLVMLTGWRTFQRQPVVLAGVALSFLYLTVLGFNSITTSYAYSQGLDEIYVSIGFGLGAVFGIVGTFLFPILRCRIGLHLSGIVGGVMQISMLSLCVVSIWLPGSPSSLVAVDNGSYEQIIRNNTTVDQLRNRTVQIRNTSNGSNPTQNPNESEKTILSAAAVAAASEEGGDVVVYTSVLVLICGIILSRAGLWITDLTVTQLQQEFVPEHERGTVGGVQFALNNLFDLLHYIITICLPYPRQFWILIFMSVFAVFIYFVAYIVFNVKHRRDDVTSEESQS